MKTKYYCYGAKFKCADYEEFLIWDKDNLDTFVKTDEGFEWVGGTWLMRDYTSVIYHHYDMVNNPSYTPMSDEDFKELTEKEFSGLDCFRLDLSKPIEKTTLTTDYLKISPVKLFARFSCNLLRNDVEDSQDHDSRGDLLGPCRDAT